MIRLKDPGSCWHLLRGVCSKLVYQLSRVRAVVDNSLYCRLSAEKSPGQYYSLLVDEVQQCDCWHHNFSWLMHRTKFQDSVNGNVAETCETGPETRRTTCVSVSGFVTFTRVSVAAYTAEPDHFFVHVFVMFQLKETNVSAIVSPSLHLRKHMKTLRKFLFSMFPLTYYRL